MRDDEKIGINGLIRSDEVLARLCGLVALTQSKDDRNKAIHNLGRYLGVGVVTGSLSLAATASPQDWVGDYAGMFVFERTDGEGYIVSDQRDGLTNAMPGATYFATMEAAMQAIDVFKTVDGDGDKFWHLLRAVQRQLPYSGAAQADDFERRMFGFAEPYHDHRLCPVPESERLNAAGRAAYSIETGDYPEYPVAESPEHLAERGLHSHDAARGRFIHVHDKPATLDVDHDGFTREYDDWEARQEAYDPSENLQGFLGDSARRAPAIDSNERLVYISEEDRSDGVRG